MKVVALESVEKFVNALDNTGRSDVYRLIGMLQQYGHELSMPYAKPIGNGLWELRKTGRPQICFLYGFCRGEVLLLLALKKQRSALRQEDIATAQKRLAAHC